jgi:hypothetical protein
MVITVVFTISGLMFEQKVDNVVTNSHPGQMQLSVMRLYPVCGYFIYKQFQEHNFVFR